MSKCMISPLKVFQIPTSGPVEVVDVDPVAQHHAGGDRARGRTTAGAHRDGPRLGQSTCVGTYEFQGSADIDSVNPYT